MARIRLSKRHEVTLLPEEGGRVIHRLTVPPGEILEESIEFGLLNMGEGQLLIYGNTAYEVTTRVCGSDMNGGEWYYLYVRETNSDIPVPVFTRPQFVGE